MNKLEAECNLNYGQEYKDLTGEAPDGWVTSPGGKGKEQAGYPKKGIVLSVSDARAFDAQRKKEAETERQYGKENPTPSKK